MTETLPDHCDGCGAPITRWLPTEPPDFGFSFDLGGSYSGFRDLEYSVFKGRLDLCHDCVIRLVELFPILRLKLGAGCHPSLTDTPCCAHAWKVDDTNDLVTLVPNGDLTGWVAVPIGSARDHIV